MSTNFVRAEQNVARTGSVVLTHPLAKQIVKDHHDTCKAMTIIGVDYPVLIQQALEGEPRAIRLMFSLAQVVKFDGAVAESYAATRYKVVSTVGDEKLVGAYSKSTKGVDFLSTRKSLLNWPNPGDDSEKAEAEIKKHIPQFWKFLTEKVK